MGETKVMNQQDQSRLSAIDISIFNHGPVVVFRWRNAEHWPVEFVTPNVQALLGYAAEEFLAGRVRYTDLIHPDDLARVAEEVQLYSESGSERFQHADYRMVARNGNIYWVEDHSQIIRDDEGEVTHYLGYLLDVTARKAAEASRRQSEAEMRAMLNAVPDLLFKLDRDGVFLDYHVQNPADLAMPPETFLGKRIVDVMPEPVGREGMETLRRALATGAVASHHYDIANLEGELRNFEARYAPTGEGGALVVVRDITDRKRAEQALHRSEVSYRHLADNLPAIVYRTTVGDCAGPRTFFFNDMMTTITGYSPEEIQNGTICDCEGFIHPDDRAEVLAAIQRAVQECRPFEVEYRIVRKNGEIAYLVDRGRPVCDDEARPSHIDGVMFDITERKQAEARLRESEARFKGIAQSMSDWIWEVDAQGVYTFCSGRVEDILGYSPEEIIGRSPFDLMPPEEAQKIGPLFADICAAKAPISNLENWNLAKNGRRVCLLTNGIPLLSEKGELLGYRGVDKDITQRKLAEEALIQAKLAAEEASQAKSEFLSRMSHELRTPLNAILGYSEMMLEIDDEPLTESQRESLGAVVSAGQHLLELITEVLDLAKVEAGKLPLSMANVDWQQVVGQCLELTRAAADKRGITLQVAIPEDAPAFVRADELRLKQVLLNLLSNAVKYNREGGSVTLTGNTTEDGRLRIAVRDTGKGLNEAELGKLFQPFSRLPAEASSSEGVGIGLVISKRLAELMGGGIEVDSVPGEGSVFSLALEAVDD